jgi:PQQ-like domain
MRTTVGTGWDAKSRWAVLAFSAAGERSWITRWGDAANHSFPTAIATSPDGKYVFVSGSWRTDQVAPDGHLTTIAFDAIDGHIVWQANYDGPGDGTDNARDIIVGPDGRSLYVAGISAGTGNDDLDYLALAYDARTGEEEWATRWDGIGQNHLDSPFAGDVNARGSMLYLTGWSYGEGEFNNDYGTIAVRTKGPDEGSVAWSARYDGVGSHAPDQASALVVSPDDSKVFVTGMSDDVDSGPPFPVNYGYATVAYDAVTGKQLWESRKQWPDTTFNAPNAIAVDPSGGRVVVSGQANLRELDFGTVTYDAATGAEAWSDRYGFQDYDLELAKDVTMDPRGDTVYVTGISAKSPPGIPGCCVLYAPNGDQLTIAYDVQSGEKKWLARFNPTTTDYVSVQAMAMSPDATTVYTATSLDDQNWDNDGDDNDAALVAYGVGPGIPLPPPARTNLVFTDASDARGQYSDETTIVARLTNAYGDPIEDADLTFEFQGDAVSAITNDDGLAEITKPLTERPDDYPLRVIYDGEPPVYAPSNLSSTYTIRKEASALTLKVKRYKCVLRATLRDADSRRPIENRKISFFVRKNRIGASRTDDSGIAVIRLPRRFARTRLPIKAIFEGDAFYRGAVGR